ncbi:hypothetical protein HLB44_31065 [Aquincola sp. S2]|uniref:Uncharacterized protein n=1 Tax=Pseudaquabacterium terrae TaxID=2732868 RepID=A0ABX2ES30_9BURK|nr:hypothetical protein [Aquabacterium terrae]NRF71436.1 hypothetical protein [Aquabacterium terrae]
MKTAAPLFAATIVAAALAFAPAVQAQENVDLGEGFLCCNMRSDGAWISDANYQDPNKTMIPFGTPMRHAGWGRYRLQVDIEGKRLEIGNDYSRTLSMEEFGRRYLVQKDPRKQAAYTGASAKVRKAIESAHVTRGMTRTQVLYAIGYPVANETPILQSTPWKYRASSGAFSVHFDGQGHVTNVHADPDTLRQVYTP